MKNILLVLLLGAAFISKAAILTVGWDQSLLSDGVTGYKLYSLVGTNRTILNSPSTNTVSITLANGMWQLAVTATNSIGESDLSLPLYVFISGTNVIAITAKPGAPINLQLR